MPNGASHYAITVNNYTEQCVPHLQSLVESSRLLYVVVGKEVGASGTPHLQGHLQFIKRVTLKQAIKALDPVKGHLTVARDIRESIEYCKKDGSFTEFGTPPEVSSKQGKRNDLEAFKNAVKSGVTDLKRLREEHSLVLSRHRRFATEYVIDHTPKLRIEDHLLRPWQSDVVAICNGPVCPRTIHFVYDPIGNTGKSWLCNYIQDRLEDVAVMSSGKRDDLAFAFPPTTKVLLFDVPRCAAEHISYQFLESVKNGRVFSPKYESVFKVFPPPHVVVFTNEEPDTKKLSQDRYNIISVYN